MDGEHRLGVREAFIDSCIALLKIDNALSRVPIVRVEDIGDKIDIGQYFHRRTAEEGESFGVVIFAVKACEQEIIFVIEEIICYTLLLVFENTAILASPGKLYRS